MSLQNPKNGIVKCMRLYAHSLGLSYIPQLSLCFLSSHRYVHAGFLGHRRDKPQMAELRILKR